jgi:hypothetical protein
VFLLLSLGCPTENEFVARPFESIAVVSGDFDNIEQTLDRLEVAYQLYEGYICCAAYDGDIDPDLISLEAEQLFTGTLEGGGTELGVHDALFVNSGARGFGRWKYNGIEEDDSIVSDTAVVEAVVEFVSRGRALVVSDWSYDLVERGWPDKIEFYGEDLDLDDAQAGNPGRITARVVDDGLAVELGGDTVSLEFNYTNWAVMESVGEGVTVYLRGDVEYRISESEGYGTLENVPLLVGWDHGSGEVLFSSFHWNSQSAGVTDTLLTSTVERLDPGNADDAPQPSEDTGAAQ